MRAPSLSGFLESKYFLIPPLLFLNTNICIFLSIPWFFAIRNFYCNTAKRCYLVLRKINTNHVWECDPAMCHNPIVGGFWQLLWPRTRTPQSPAVATQSQCRLSSGTSFSCCWGLPLLHRPLVSWAVSWAQSRASTVAQSCLFRLISVSSTSSSGSIVIKSINKASYLIICAWIVFW